MLGAGLSAGASVGTACPGRRGRCLELPRGSACLPATLKIAAPLLHTTLKYTWCVCVRSHLYVCPINSPPAYPPLFILTSYRLSNFYFLCDRSYNLKMQMCGLLWSLMRTSLYCVLTSIRQDYRDRGTLAFGQCHSDSTCCCCHSQFYHWAFSPPSVN